MLRFIVAFSGVGLFLFFAFCVGFLCLEVFCGVGGLLWFLLVSLVCFIGWGVVWFFSRVVCVGVFSGLFVGFIAGGLGGGVLCLDFFVYLAWYVFLFFLGWSVFFVCSVGGAEGGFCVLFFLCMWFCVVLGLLLFFCLDLAF